jgi:hypothetical protein
MAINIYPEACEFTINAKKSYDIIFFAQRCYESLVNDNDKWQYNGTTLCPSSIFRLEGSHCKISSSHGGEYDDQSCLLGYTAYKQ